MTPQLQGIALNRGGLNRPDRYCPVATILPLFIFLISFSLPIVAQKTVTEVGESMVRVENQGMTIVKAKNEALLQARLNAAEKAFGTVIRGESYTWLKTTTAGQEIGTKSAFDFVANNYLKGEWVSDIGEPEFETVTRNNEIWYKCRVKCKVRELKERKVEFESYPLSCPQLTCKTETFNNNQQLYFYFKSAEKGFVSIFLAVDGDYFRLLPYKQANDKLYNAFPVEADKEYIFFNTDNIYYGETVDGMTLYTNDPIEYNILWVIYSPNEFSKPLLTDHSQELPQETTANGSELPKSISSGLFLKWIQKIRTADDQMQVEIYGISIKK